MYTKWSIRYIYVTEAFDVHNTSGAIRQAVTLSRRVHCSADVLVVLRSLTTLYLIIREVQ